MAAFPYRSVRGLGALQVFLSVVSICLGVGDLVAGLSNWRGPGFGVYYISTGTWTGLSVTLPLFKRARCRNATKDLTVN